MFITELTLFIISILLAHIFIRWYRHQREALNTFNSANIPGPSPIFLIGNNREYNRDNVKHLTLDRWAQKYGSYYGFYQGTIPVLVLADVDDVHEVLSRNGRYFPNRQRSTIRVEPFTSSILNLRGERWRHSRRVLTPSFTAHKITMQTTKQTISNAVKLMLKMFEKQRLSSNITNDGGSFNVDLARYMNCVTLDTISRFAFSMEKTDVWEDNSHLRHITKEFLANSGNNLAFELAIYFPILGSLMTVVFNTFGGGQFVEHMTKHLNQCVIEYYQKRIKQHFGQQQEEKKLTSTPQVKMSLLDFMMEQQEKGNLNEVELIGNSMVVLLAGYETTATALTYTLYLLAKHQDIQRKLREEILQRFPYTNHKDDDESINYCHFDDSRCELLDRVWYESLRLYPPVVAFMTREMDDQSSCDTLKLTKSGVTVTKEMTIMIPVWTIHHDARHWPEPNRYDPYRKNLPIPGSSLPASSSAAFLPFGIGPRNCIGGNLATSEARAVLTAILSHYQLDLVKESELLDEETGLLQLHCTSIIIHPVKDIVFKMTPIKQ